MSITFLLNEKCSPCYLNTHENKTFKKININTFATELPAFILLTSIYLFEFLPVHKT